MVWALLHQVPCAFATPALFFFLIILRFCSLLALRNLHHHSGGPCRISAPFASCKHQPWPLQSLWPSSWFCIPVLFLYSQRSFLLSLCLNFILLCIIQRIMSRAEAIGLATTKMASESKHKDDISDRVLYILTSFPHISGFSTAAFPGWGITVYLFPLEHRLDINTRLRTVQCHAWGQPLSSQRREELSMILIYSIFMCVLPACMCLQCLFGAWGSH